MTRLYIGRLGWLAGIVLLAAILLLATRIDARRGPFVKQP
jgi:hypothetical protein